MKLRENEFENLEKRGNAKIPKHKISEVVAGFNIQDLIKDARHARHTLHTREGFYNHVKFEDFFGRPRTQLSRRAMTASSKSTTKTVSTSASMATTFQSSNLLYFHHLCGSNVRLSFDRHTATRKKDSFCNGISFGYRPITVGEIVHLKFNKVRTCWRGGIKLGFTNFNPTYTDKNLLPSYAIPDTSHRIRYWAVPLADRYVAKNNVFSFTLTDEGRIIYFINNENKGTFLKGLNVNESHWPMFDLYGKIGEISVVTDQIAKQGVAMNLGSDDESSLNNAVVNEAPKEGESHLPVLRFHRRVGANIKLNADRRVAKRIESFWNSLSFLSEPFKVDDILFIEVLEQVNDYAGALGVGVTNVNPSTISSNELPDNADLLTKKPEEFWKISRDIETTEGDQLGFEIDDEGAITCSKNGSLPIQFLKIDSTFLNHPLWLIFDIYGSTKAVRTLGIIKGVNPIHNDVTRCYAINDYADYDNNDTECFMCYKKDRVRNCVIQPCGHTTFCDWCSITCLIKQQLRFIVCPVCGGPIVGVIKIISTMKRKQSLALSFDGSEIYDQ